MGKTAKVAKGVGTFMLVKRVLRLGFGAAAVAGIVSVLRGRSSA